MRSGGAALGVARALAAPHAGHFRTKLCGKGYAIVLESDSLEEVLCTRPHESRRPRR